MNDPVYFVCKYTPVELLAGFSLPCERLDPAPSAFSCADACGHPNLCGFGKAVLEEVLGKGIRRLLLVDCCDVCRRIYDILLARGGMDFLYLLPLPHKQGPAERKIFARDLERLRDALAAWSGVSFRPDLALAAWKTAATSAEAASAEASSPHITLTGAHGGSLLLRAAREKSALPVMDQTCTGVRNLSPCPDRMPEDFLAAYAAALLGQSPACMRMQFREEVPDPGAAGIICHTVKFCDYYGFQYARLRKSAAPPVLKIETDCTPQSSGQLATRLEAFSETLGVRSIHMSVKTAARFVAGVDSGSASTDAVILDTRGSVVGAAVLPTGAGASAGADRALEAALREAGIPRGDLGTVVTTGYGRDHIAGGNASVTEITCHARGAHHLLPAARTVIDIGGQDSKVIRLDENGRVVNFVMNDKCAAGTGRFLELMARTLEMTLPEMSEKGLRWNKPVTISSMCTVFAESEVVSLIAGNADPADIIHGLNMAVANKTASLVTRLGGQPAYVMTGGVAMNRGVVQALEEKLKAEIVVPREAQLCGALGAALFALDAEKEK